MDRNAGKLIKVFSVITFISQIILLVLVLNNFSNMDSGTKVLIVLLGAIDFFSIMLLFYGYGMMVDIIKKKFDPDDDYDYKPTYKYKSDNNETSRVYNSLTIND